MNSNFNAAIFHRGRHLAGDELVDATDTCPICSSPGKRGKAIFLQKNPEVSLLECQHCGGLSSSKMPTDDALNEYYRSYYTGNSAKLTFHNVSRLAKHIYGELDTKVLYRKKVIRILDFGGGDGSLAMGLAKMIRGAREVQKIEVVLIDFNSEASYEEASINLMAHRTLREAFGVFDIILASAILEHIPELHTTVPDLAARLAPGGYFYARTPYVVPFKKILTRMDFTFPAHVHDLGPSFWNKFLNTFLLDWEVIFSQSSIVETQFDESFFRTLMAYVLKFPSRLEEQFSDHVIVRPYWKYVGGWEVLFVKKR